MSERKTEKHLTIKLITLMIQLILGVAFIIIMDVGYKVISLTTLLYIALAILMYLAFNTGMDLMKRDYRTIVGKLITLSNSLLVVEDDYGKSHKLRLYERPIHDINKDRAIEVKYYIRTKAVKSIAIVKT